jgi:hypothetical protein
MYDVLSGELIWSVDTAGYEIDPDKEPRPMDDSKVAARFHRSRMTDGIYDIRGVIRAKGGEKRKYRPMQDAPGLARRVAGLYPLGSTEIVPTDAAILGFARKYGLLFAGDEMPIRDFIYTAKYMSAFASGVDSENRHVARDVFNDRVLPRMTVRLVGAASGEPTAIWKLEVEPTDLISAAWLQMAAELTDGKRLKKCEAPDCLEWFPDRRNKKFCNNRCKMAFHKQIRETQ